MVYSGSKRADEVCLWHRTQRGVLMLSLIMFPIIIVVWLFASGPVFRMLGLDEETAGLATDYCRINCFGLWPMLITRCIQGFLRSQRIVRPVMWCGGLSSLVTTLFCFWAIDEYSFYGAPMGIVFGSWLNLGLLLIYCKTTGVHHKCWGGWTKAALEDLGMLTKLAAAGSNHTSNLQQYLVSSGIFSLACTYSDSWRVLTVTQIMGQWWSMELAAGMAGTLGSVPLAAHSIICKYTSNHS